MTSLTLFSTFLLIIAATYSSPIPDNEPEKLAKVGNETLPISEQQAQKIKELIQSADVVQEIPISGELAETIQKLVKNQQVEEVAEESAEYETTEVLSSETAGNGTVIDGKSGPVRSYGPMGKPIKLMMPGAQGPVKRTQVIQTRYINGKPEFRVVTRTRRSGIDDVGSMISGGAKNIANIISGAVQTGADGWTALNQVAANVIGKAAGTGGKVIDKILGTDLFHGVGEAISGGANDLAQGFNEGIQSLAAVHTGISRGVSEIITDVAHKSADIINNVVLG